MHSSEVVLWCYSKDVSSALSGTRGAAAGRGGDDEIENGSLGFELALCTRRRLLGHDVRSSTLLRSTQDRYANTSGLFSPPNSLRPQHVSQRVDPRRLDR